MTDFDAPTAAQLRALRDAAAEAAVDLRTLPAVRTVKSGTWGSLGDVTVTTTKATQHTAEFTIEGPGGEYRGERFRIARRLRDSDAEFFADRLTVTHLAVGMDDQPMFTVTMHRPFIDGRTEPFEASNSGVVREDGNPIDPAVSVICNTL